MRYRFDEQLKELHTGLIGMGALCEQSIANATKALLEDGNKYAQRCMELEEEINKKERDLERLCYQLLMMQQPVARDLRLVSSALKMITDMERIGDQASDIAEITVLNNVTPDDDTYTIKEMSLKAIAMVTKSIDAYVQQDLELAREVIGADDEVDALFNQSKQQLTLLLAQNPERAESAIDMLMVAKYLERIADHAVNIARWVVFAVTGSHDEGGDA